MPRTPDSRLRTFQCQGGTLAKISSEADNQLIWSMAQEAGIAEYWVGAVRVDSSNEDAAFAWRDGSPLEYSNWLSGEVSTLCSKTERKMTHPNLAPARSRTTSGAKSFVFELAMQANWASPFGMM